MGATRVKERRYTIHEVSIHAPVMGATIHRFMLCNTASFNPRTRDGCDAKHQKPNQSLVSFNPRTRDGCDGND